MRILCEVTKAHGELIAVSCSMHGYEQKSDHLLYYYIVIASISCLFWKKKMFRTRAVQKIIETVNNPDQVSKIVSALNPGAMHLVLDPNGSHVANRCLQKLLPKSKAVCACQSSDLIMEISVPFTHYMHSSCLY